MKKTITALMALSLSVIWLPASASEQGQPGHAYMKDAVTPAPGLNYAKEKGIYRGIVEVGKSGLTLINGTGTYLLKQDPEPGVPALETMVGKVVMVSGRLEKNKHGILLIVTNAVAAE